MNNHETTTIQPKPPPWVTHDHHHSRQYLHSITRLSTSLPRQSSRLQPLWSTTIAAAAVHHQDDANGALKVACVARSLHPSHYLIGERLFKPQFYCSNKLQQLCCAHVASTPPHLQRSAATAPPSPSPTSVVALCICMREGSCMKVKMHRVVCRYIAERERKIGGEEEAVRIAEKEVQTAINLPERRKLRVVRTAEKLVLTAINLPEEKTESRVNSRKDGVNSISIPEKKKLRSV